MWYDVSIGSCEVVRFSLPGFHPGHTGSNPVRNTHQPLVIDCVIFSQSFGGVAQLVAHLFCTQKVKGSSPFISTYASLAQLVERRNHNS